MALSVPIRCPEHPGRPPIVASSKLNMQPLRVCETRESGINTLAVGQWRCPFVGKVCQFDHYLDGKMQPCGLRNLDSRCVGLRTSSTSNT
jgi:hypothetical protein